MSRSNYLQNVPSKTAKVDRNNILFDSSLTDSGQKNALFLSP